MDGGNLSRVLKLLGLASLGYAVFETWTWYNSFEQRMLRGLAETAQNLGQKANINWDLSGIAPTFAQHLVVSPWLWAGVALVVAGFAAVSWGGARQKERQASVGQRWNACQSCEGLTPEGVPYCDHCGKELG